MHKIKGHSIEAHQTHRRRRHSRRRRCVCRGPSSMGGAISMSGSSSVYRTACCSGGRGMMTTGSYRLEELLSN